MKEKKRFWLYDIYTLQVDGRKAKHRLVSDYWILTANKKKVLTIRYEQGPAYRYCIDTFEDKKKAISEINHHIRNLRSMIF